MNTTISPLLELSFCLYNTEALMFGLSLELLDMKTQKRIPTIRLLHFADQPIAHGRPSHESAYRSMDIRHWLRCSLE